MAINGLNMWHTHILYFDETLSHKTIQLNENILITINVFSELVASTYIILTYFKDLYFLTKLYNSMKIIITYHEDWTTRQITKRTCYVSAWKPVSKTAKKTPILTHWKDSHFYTKLSDILSNWLIALRNLISLSLI